MKKPRHRIWWYPVFEAEEQELRRTMLLTETDGEWPILYDREDQAYALAYAHRLEPKRNEDGSIITNDQGYAQLTNHGRITLIGIRGSVIDWKKVKHIKAEGLKGHAIVVQHPIPLNPQTYKKVLQESEQAYVKAISSPLARAGGIEPPPKQIEETDEPDQEAVQDQSQAG